MLKKFRSTTQVCLALLLSLFSTNVLPVAVANAAPADKVFVCKYVGTPGVNETLQTGQNPISVSSNATGDTAVGSYFADQHGRSFVLAIDSGQPEPSVSECPAPQSPTAILVPTVPVSDPCGPQNAVYGTVPAGNYSVLLNNDGSITLTANTGFVFTGNLSSVTLPAPTDSNVTCPVEPTVIPVPSVPVTDPCGPQNAIYGTVPAGNYSSQLNQDGSITLTADTGYVFTGNLTEVTLPAPTDSNEACEVVTCPANQEWFDMNDNGLVDEDECFKKVFVCKYVGTPGIDERLQTGQNPISVSVNAIPDFQGVGSYFADAQGRSFVLAFDIGQEEPDVSECPTGSTRDLDFNYGDVCSEESDGEVSVEISNDGNAAANDLVVNLYDGDNNLVDTQTVDVPAGEEVEVVFEGLDLDLYTIRVYDGETLLSSESELEVDECGGGIIDVCPNIEGLQFVIPQGLVKDDRGNCVTDQCPLVPGVQTNTTLCPSGGHVLDDTSTASRGGGQVLPATLPATGASENLFAIVFAMIAAYGAVYFLQGRRQLGSALEK